VNTPIDIQEVIDVDIVVFETSCLFHYIRMVTNKSEI